MSRFSVIRYVIVHAKKVMRLDLKQSFFGFTTLYLGNIYKVISRFWKMKVHFEYELFDLYYYEIINCTNGNEKSLEYLETRPE